MQLKVAKVHKPGGKEKGMGVELNEVYSGTPVHSQALSFDPLAAMGICLNKQKLMYMVLAPSIITPI